MTRRSSRRHATLALALALAALASASACRTTAPDCRFESTERCRWEAGVTPPKPGTVDPSIEGDPVNPAVVADKAELDQALGQMISIIGAGLEWPLVDEQARKLCHGEQSGPTPSVAWTCGVGKLRINDQSLALEASDGVLSLSAAELDEAQSEELFEFARRRFAGWCAGGPFRRLEGDGLQEFYRCSLPEGPYLVVARFPRELKAGLWQVSIAILDAG